MSNVKSASQDPSDPASLPDRQDGRNPPPDILPRDGFTALTGMRESTRYGILLYFMRNSTEWPLSDGQILWIVYRARKLSLAELLRAGQFSGELNDNKETFRRTLKQIKETYFRVPSLNPKLIPEKRTIGIGYRDKGSLRPLHQQRRIGEEVFWDEDIAYLLPLNHKIEGRWITAEEVESLIGVDLLILAVMQSKNMTQIRNFHTQL